MAVFYRKHRRRRGHPDGTHCRADASTVGVGIATIALVALITGAYTAEGPISYWNAYVAVTQMGGHGNFSDARLGIDIKQSPDMVTPKLAALRAYAPNFDSRDCAYAARI